MIVDMLWCNAISLPCIVHTIYLCDKLYKLLQSIKADVNQYMGIHNNVGL